jgi:phosphoribosyl-ATP pyrophosphohydrolase
MKEYNLTVRPFRMGTEKESAIKVLEEASEVRAAWQELSHRLPTNECYESGYPHCDCEAKRLCETYNNPEILMLYCGDLADEIADVIQAACNLADRYNINVAAAMKRCEQRNRDRGRYEVQS